MAAELEVDRSYLSQIESGKKDPGRKLIERIRILETEGIYRTNAKKSQEGNKPRVIRVLSWARAGQGGAYEELPEDWQETTANDCQDPKAFALKIEGDSMEPFFKEGDTITVMPSFKPYPDSLVVAKLKNGDVTFKVMRFLDASGEKLSLTGYNTTQAREVTVDDLEWIYPVYGMWRRTWSAQLWKAQHDQRAQNPTEAKPEY